MRAAYYKFEPKARRQLFKLIEGGDIQALRIYIDRVYPALKAELFNPSVPIAETATEQAGIIIGHMLSGDLSVEAGNQMLAAITTNEKLHLMKQISGQAGEGKFTFTVVMSDDDIEVKASNTDQKGPTFNDTEKADIARPARTFDSRFECVPLNPDGSPVGSQPGDTYVDADGEHYDITED